MVVIRKDEDEWWFAQHEDGRQGAIPVPYVEVVSPFVHACHYSLTSCHFLLKYFNFLYMFSGGRAAAQG